MSKLLSSDTSYRDWIQEVSKFLIPWGHQKLLIDKCKNDRERAMRMTDFTSYVNIKQGTASEGQ